MNAQDTQIALRHRLCRRRVAQIRGMGYDASRCRAASPGEKLAARRQLSIPEDALVLLCAAEFSRRKNQSFLLDAMLGLSRNTVLLLPGDGERLDACQKRADDLGLAGRVFFPGYVSDLSLWRAASDICVSAARSEGLPFHVMEAMACGLPCVLSAVKGHEDLAFGARLFPYGDRAAFAQAVNDVSVRTRVPEGIEDYRLENVLKDNLNLFSGGRI